jgi:hypothetical protein|nr:MAG TPA: hypothetical protein [Caudoviricetes sp.]
MNRQVDMLTLVLLIWFDSRGERYFFLKFFILKGEMIMEKMKHGAVYTCRRLRLLSYLKEHGRLPFETIPDVRNPLFNVWRFRNDAELEQLIDDYFAEIESNKQ